MGRNAKIFEIVVCISIIICLGLFVRGEIIRCDTIPKQDKQEIKQERRKERRKDIREQSFISLLRSAQRWYSVKELTGKNDHPMITKSMKLCGLDGNKGYAWCASAQADIHDYAEVPAPHSARVVDWFKQNVVWEKRFGEIPKYIDKKGMVGGMYYSKLGRLGHIVLIIGESEKYYYTLEGNTSAWGSIEWDEGDNKQREGDGFYKKVRNKESISALADYCLNGQMFYDEYNLYLQKFLK